MSPSVPIPAEKAELESILSSEIFTKSPSLARLLEYLCERYFEGKASELKEYNIAVEALGRSPDFDPSTSSIVRVEVHRLREKLKRYYETDGAAHPVMIALQVGHYVPQFVWREEVSRKAPTTEAPAASGIPGVLETEAAREREHRRVEGAGPLMTSETDSVAVGKPAPSLLDQRRQVSRKGRLLALFVALSIVLVAIMAWMLARPRWPGGRVRVAAPDSNVIPGIVEQGEEIRIMAGYFKDTYIDRRGKVWRGDRYFTGGTASTQPWRFIAHTSDHTLYQTSRTGEFAYDIPLKPRTHELRLHFVETYFGPGTLVGGGETSRIFNVDMNGKPLLTELDLIRDAGGPNVAHVRVFKDVTPAGDGYLHLRFRAFKDVPTLNALEIVPTRPGKLHPTRIVAQTNSYTDRKGQVWDPDCYFSGGQVATRKGPAERTVDPGLYTGERYGNFNYAVPVAKGKYAVTLGFAETYFGPQNVGFGGVGSRVFHVYCNGVALLRNFDIFKEAGGANRALYKTFHGIEPNSAGMIVLSFVPVVNYACVNAIEVLDESQ